MQPSSQKTLFESMHAQYYSAVREPSVMAYKEEFIYRPVLQMLGGAESVAELACGTGEGSAWLQQKRPELKMTGLEISEPACRAYELNVGRPCLNLDLTKPQMFQTKFDAAVVFGGIHHLLGGLDAAMANIAALVRPGGSLVMVEPNADYFLQPVRRLWYKLDRKHFDASTEDGLSHDRLHAQFAHMFKKDELMYIGGPAYFLIAQNWLLRIPNRAVKLATPAALAVERKWHRLPGRLVFSSFIAKWTRT